MADKQIKIVVTLTGDQAAKNAKKLKDEFSDTFELVADEVKSAGKEVKEFGKTAEDSFEKTGAGAVAAGQMVARFAEAGIQQLQQFTRSIGVNTLEYRKVRATVKNLGADMSAIDAGIKKIDKSYGTSTENLNTYFKVHSGGITEVGEALSLTGDIAQLAYGEMADVDSVAAAAIKVKNVYGDAFTSTGQMLGQISAIAKAGDTNLQAVASSLPTVLQSAKDLNVGFSDMGGALSFLTQRFRSTEQSATYLDAFFTSLKRNTDQAAAAAEKLEIEWSADALVNQGLTGFLKTLDEAIEKSGKTKGEIAELMLQLTGSSEASRALSAMVDGMEDIPPLMQEIGRTGAERLKEVSDNMKEADGGTAELKNSWHQLTLELGDHFAPMALYAVRALNGMMPVLEFLIRNLPVLSAMGAAYAAKAYGPQVIASIKGFTGAIKGASLAMKATSIVGLSLIAIDFVGWLLDQKDKAEELKEASEGIRDAAKQTKMAWQEIEEIANSTGFEGLSSEELKKAYEISYAEYRKQMDWAINLGDGKTDGARRAAIDAQKDAYKWKERAEGIKAIIDAREAETKAVITQRQETQTLAGFLSILDNDEKQLLGTLKNKQIETALINEKYAEMTSRIKALHAPMKMEKGLLADVEALRRKDLASLTKVNKELEKQKKEAGDLYNKYKPLNLQLADFDANLKKQLADMKKHYGQYPGYSQAEKKLTQSMSDKRFEMIKASEEYPALVAGLASMGIQIEAVGEKTEDLIAIKKLESEYYDDLRPQLATINDKYQLITASIKAQVPEGEKRNRMMGNALKAYVQELAAIGQQTGAYKSLTNAYSAVTGQLTSYAKALGLVESDTHKNIKATRSWNEEMADLAYSVSNIFNTLSNMAGNSQIGQFFNGMASAFSSFDAGFSGLNAAAGQEGMQKWLTMGNAYLQFAAGGAGIVNGLFGYNGMFGSKKYDDEYAAEWLGGMGINNNALLTQLQNLIGSLRQQGYDKFQARKIAELQMVPQIVDSLESLTQVQFDKLLWGIGHGMEEMGGGMSAWRAAMPGVAALLDEIDGKTVQWTDHISAFMSNLISRGLATDEMLQTSFKWAEDSQLIAWFSELSIGIDRGSLSVSDFVRQFSLLWDEAESRGLSFEGQLQQIFQAAANAGWTLEDVTQALTAQMEFYAQTIADLTEQIRSVQGQIDSTKQSIMNTKMSIFEWKMWGHDEAKSKIKDLATAYSDAIAEAMKEKDLEKRAEMITDAEKLRFKYNRKAWTSDDGTRSLSQGQFEGSGAYDAIMETVDAMTGGYTEALTFREMKEIVKGVEGSDNQQAVWEYLKSVNNALLLEDQLQAQKDQLKALKDQKNELKRTRQKTIDKLQSIKDSVRYLENHWNQLISKEDKQIQHLASIDANISSGIKVEMRASGGLVSGTQLYSIAEQGPEYVMSNSALNAYGLDFMDAVNAGQYRPGFIPIPAPIEYPEPPKPGEMPTPSSSNQGRQAPVIENLNFNPTIVINKEVDIEEIQNQLNDMAKHAITKAVENY